MEIQMVVTRQKDCDESANLIVLMCDNTNNEVFGCEPELLEKTVFVPVLSFC